MPANEVTFYNRIDVGIFICFLELCFEHQGQAFERILYIDNGDNCAEKVLTAEYKWK